MKNDFHMDDFYSDYLIKSESLMLSYNTENSMENALKFKIDYKWTIFSREGNHHINYSTMHIFILHIFHYAFGSHIKNSEQK